MAESEGGAGAPLTATVSEELREKARTEQALSHDREVAARQGARVERRKSDEQETAVRHAGAPDRWAEARRDARRAPVRRRELGVAQLAAVALLAAVLGALLRRR